jgi:hypothetical protein
MSAADAIRLREFIAARVADGQDILADLDRYFATGSSRPRRLAGCCAVGPDGSDRR